MEHLSSKQVPLTSHLDVWAGVHVGLVGPESPLKSPQNNNINNSSLCANEKHLYFTPCCFFSSDVMQWYVILGSSSQQDTDAVWEG